MLRFEGREEDLGEALRLMREQNMVQRTLAWRQGRGRPRSLARFIPHAVQTRAANALLRDAGHLPSANDGPSRDHRASNDHSPPSLLGWTGRAFGDPDHRVWRQAPCGDAAGRQGRNNAASRLAVGSLPGCCWLMVAHTMPLVDLMTKFGGRLPAGMLQAHGGVTTLLTALIIKFGGGLSAGMLLADGGPEDAFGGPDDQVWRRARRGDAAEMLQADGRTTTLLAVLVITFGGRLPAMMLMADSSVGDHASGSASSRTGESRKGEEGKAVVERLTRHALPDKARECARQRPFVYI